MINAAARFTAVTLLAGATLTGTALSASAATDVATSSAARVATCRTLAPAVGNFHRGFVDRNSRTFRVDDLLLTGGAVLSVEDNAKAGGSLAFAPARTAFLRAADITAAELRSAGDHRKPANAAIVAAHARFRQIFAICGAIDRNGAA